MNGDIYSFGSDFYGQQGQGSTTEKRSFPVVMDWGPFWLGGRGKRVVDVGCGSGHTLLVTNEGEVWGVGNDDCGQLGSGKQGSTSRPRKAHLYMRVGRVECASGSSFFLTDDGQLLSCGWNDASQLGHDDGKERDVPTVIQALQEKVVVDVECGLQCAIAKTREGDWFCWGKGSFSNAKVIRPTKLDLLHNCITLRERFALSSNGEIWDLRNIVQQHALIPLELPEGCCVNMFPGGFPTLMNLAGWVVVKHSLDVHSLYPALRQYLRTMFRYG